MKTPDLYPIKRVVIIGGGFTGTMVAVRLLNDSSAPLEIVLIEKRKQVGRGLAYSTDCQAHLLNVRAQAMSAYPDQPLHFLQFARRVDPAYSQDSFAPRALYGAYIQAILRESLHRASAKPVSYQVSCDEAIDLDHDIATGKAVVQLASGQSLAADYVVLATGNLPSRPPEHFPKDLLSSGRYIHDPWSRHAAATIGSDTNVLIIGTGLTAVDTVVELLKNGYRGQMVALSRHGLLPRAHSNASMKSCPVPEMGLPASALDTLRFVRHLASRNQDWRPALDSLRPVTQDWWRQLPDHERTRFLRHLQALWDVHRHRMAPEIATLIEGAISSGRLTVQAGRVLDLSVHGSAISVRIGKRGSIDTACFTVNRVVNCTGFSGSVSRLDSALIHNLLARGIATIHPLGTGVNTDCFGHLIDQHGQPQRRLLTAGPTLKPQLFESVAVPELRVQARHLAELLLSELGQTSGYSQPSPLTSRVPALLVP